MCARRVPGTSSQASGKGARGQNKLKAVRFLGLHLAGPKNDRTSLAVFEYYANQKKLFLTHIYEHIQPEGDISSDQILFQTIKNHELEGGIQSLAVDAPLSVPVCTTCKLKCPGYEKCKEKEIVWMWKQYKKKLKSKPRSKIFSPYVQRVAEYYINSELDENLPPLETFGANTAPMAARAQFLKRRLPKLNMIEVYPQLSVLRIGAALKITKSHTSHYKHSVGGDESRHVILDQMLKKDLVFVYQQDYLRLINNSDAFEAFINGITAFLKYAGVCEKVPKDVPLKQGWIDFPTCSFDL